MSATSQPPHMNVPLHFSKCLLTDSRYLAAGMKLPTPSLYLPNRIFLVNSISSLRIFVFARTNLGALVSGTSFLLASIIHYSITGRNIRQNQELWGCHKNVQIGNTPRGSPVETKMADKKRIS